MKKLTLLFVSLFALTTLQAQWVNDPAINTLIANTSADASEIYVATNPVTGDTYVQWMQFGTNGWSPYLQRLNFDGEHQWDAEGIHIAAHEFSSMSEGVAMTTTADGGVVSSFANYDGYTYAVKINPDGTFPWGEQGIKLFGGLGFSRTELAAGDDGGFWALGADYNNSYIQYVNADGTLNPYNTITSDKKCIFGQLTVSNDNNVFLTYEKLGNGMYTDKEIRLIGFDTQGNAICEDVQLMAPQNFQSTYIHYVLPDGLGGGYAYIWHAGYADSFNTYVFHFDENGVPTINDPNGVTVHTTDPAYFYLDANATIDPVSHDILIAYLQVDSNSQSHYSLFVNRISTTGERKWGEGLELLISDNKPIGDLHIDAFEDGSGFSVIFAKGIDLFSDHSSVEALGFDNEGEHLWNTTVSSETKLRSMCWNNAGFYDEQNVTVWADANNGGLYGQNIHPDGTMGEPTPPTPPTPCDPPTNFQAAHSYIFPPGNNTVTFEWTAPEILPLHYNLYCEESKYIIEIDAEDTNYFMESMPYDESYFRLTAVYEDCESDFALTPDGDNYIHFTAETTTPENESEVIITLSHVYTITGQRIQHVDLEKLKPGLYILQGLTSDGKLVTRKIQVD